MSSSNKHLTVLFDESGTPTFSQKSNSTHFLGVALLYETEDESALLNDLKSTIGLTKSKPIKNDKFSSQKAIDCVKILGTRNIYISARYVRLDDSDLRTMLQNYEKFGNLSRELYRGITTERKIPQILHSQIMGECIADLIFTYGQNHIADSYTFEPYIDNWSYAKPDKHIVTEFTSENLEKKLHELLKENSNRHPEITIKPIELLTKQSSDKKRLIDSLTSSISRAFYNINDPKYNKTPLTILTQSLGDRFTIIDVTPEMTVFINNVMYDDIQGTKVKEKPLIIL